MNIATENNTIGTQPFLFISYAGAGAAGQEDQRGGRPSKIVDGGPRPPLNILGSNWEGYSIRTSDAL